MIFEKSDFILFTGDSVTDADRKHPVGEGLWQGVGNGFVRYIDSLLNAFYPELNLRIANTGCSGNTTRHLRERWERDMLNFKPDYLCVCIGINDVWRQFDEPSLTYDHVSPEEYRENLDYMLESAKKVVKKDIVVMSPYYMEPLKKDMMRARMDEYGAICKELAEKHGTKFVDLQKVFDDYLKVRHSSYITWDRIHPSGTGCVLIANAFFKALGISLKLK